MIHPNNVTPNHRNSGGVIPSRNQISQAGLLSATTHERSPTSQVNSQIEALRNQSNMSARYSPIVPGATRRQGSITPSPGLQEETDATAADLSTSTRHNLPVDTLDFGDYPEVNNDEGISSPRATVETDIRHPNANSAPLAVSHAWRPSTTRNQAMESYSTLPLDIEVAYNIHGLLGITSENRPLVDALSHVSGAQSARDHVYGAAIRARSRHQIQEILMDPQHKAYTQTQDPEGRPYDYTPLTCMRRWMTNQSQPFKTKHLPPQFHEGDSEAMASVVGFICNLLKQERASLRTLLLTNIKRDGGRCGGGFVPRLYDLFFVIEASFRTRDQRRTTQEVEQLMTPALKLQVNLMQMITAHHFLNRLPGDSASQWELIDDQLNQIRTWTGHKKQAFATLLVRRDRELFTGRAMIEDIKPQMVRLPTNEEVEELRLSMAGETEGADPLIGDNALPM
ncbi:hypothetical protein PCASD_13699 [Puccinia coronata f. sp. avenae]|uniref:Uncharacterized protein n=1 Tax=Puccinia coronata f. sp. avenae TaxID=200324 RepID=A0A2N5UF78_9BASI|nr:hypothetical protein PCASD_13699 [Puccinia coronata f. sp. avenae]